MEKDKLFNYRQPMVTAAGIILGFVLNFATEIVKQEKKDAFFAALILIPILAGIILLILSLYRILNNQYDPEKARLYYKRTLGYFVRGRYLFFYRSPV
ncbi:hypothetical protein [Flavihumibacter sp. CACIAM 22H1]|uniref:hypothetical protein n=1 Tax=Flavihumibacter sp. CACIAM 22H1 TaxID=1812911 RepID=UPI0007A830D1|nr:hypothetical protein [Flavihumibacter sp. CACIAM 22H1]KYP15246.1 MAG: hypothetical protein A1D16_15160 [Flavihumibacter sp. CACIAM 22H1]